MPGDLSDINSVIGQSLNWVQSGNELVSQPLDQEMGAKYIGILKQAGIEAKLVDAKIYIPKKEISPSANKKINPLETCQLTPAQIKSEGKAVTSQVETTQSETSQTIVERAKDHPAFFEFFGRQELQAMPKGTYFFTGTKDPQALILVINRGAGGPPAGLKITYDQGWQCLSEGSEKFESLDQLLQVFVKNNPQLLGLPLCDAIFVKHENIYSDRNCKTLDQARQKLWEYQQAFPEETHVVLVGEPGKDRDLAICLTNPGANSKQEAGVLPIKYDPEKLEYDIGGKTYVSFTALMEDFETLAPGYQVFTEAKDALVSNAGVREPENPDFRKPLSKEIRSTGTNFEAAAAIQDKVWTDYRKELHNHPELAELLTEPIPLWREIQPSSGALNILIDNLHAKSPEVNCFECRSLEEMKQVMKVIQDSNFEGKISLLVRSARFDNEDDDPMHVHLTPVLIEKRDHKMKIFVADSIGAEKEQKLRGVAAKGALIGRNDPDYSKHMGKIREMETAKFFSQNVYSFLVEADLNADIYVADPIRQFSGVDCSVFSFNDVRQFFKTDRFFEKLNQHGGIAANPDDPRLHHVRNIPPLNMKLAQSWTVLKDYLSENDPGRQNGYLEDPKAQVTRAEFQKSVQKSTRVQEGDQKMLNVKSADRNAKNAYVLTHYCQTRSMEELREISTQYNAGGLTRKKLETLNREKPKG